MGCNKDDEKVEETGKKDKNSGEKADFGPLIAAPLAPADLLDKLPGAPVSLLAMPGQDATKLKKNKTLSESPYSSRFLTHSDPKGPFRLVHYQLSKDRKKVVAVMGTFHDAYRVKERKEALFEVTASRLGKGTAFKNKKYVGERWPLIDYRVELRTDLKDQSLELLFHRRGHFDPTAAPPSKPE